MILEIEHQPDILKFLAGELSPQALDKFLASVVITEESELQLMQLCEIWSSSYSESSRRFDGCTAPALDALTRRIQEDD